MSPSAVTLTSVFFRMRNAFGPSPWANRSHALRPALRPGPDPSRPLRTGAARFGFGACFDQELNDGEVTSKEPLGAAHGEVTGSAGPAELGSGRGGSQVGWPRGGVVPIIHGWCSNLAIDVETKGPERLHFWDLRHRPCRARVVRHWSPAGRGGGVRTALRVPLRGARLPAEGPSGRCGAACPRGLGGEARGGCGGQGLGGGLGIYGGWFLRWCSDSPSGFRWFRVVWV